MRPSAGFCEIDHGADAALEVWAPDLSELFRQASIGMQVLMGMEPAGGQPVERGLTIQGEDDESLLVGFLSQLLFWLDQEHRAFSVVELTLQQGRLDVRLSGALVSAIQREIKAVTYNDLALQQSKDAWTVKIVFDL